MLTLQDISVGETVTVARVSGDGAFSRRIMDMGFTKGAQVTINKVAPLGDPLELTLRNYNLSLRRSDASVIEVTR
jgi:ferrous iron transport protein A